MPAPKTKAPAKKAPAKKATPKKTAPVKKAAPEKTDKPKFTRESFTADQKAMHKAAVIEALNNGQSLRSYCDNGQGRPKVPTVIAWLSDDPQFSEQYTRAREAGADVLFDDLDDVSDEAVRAVLPVQVQALRLKADNIKWKLARMAPKKYGDKLQVDAKVEEVPKNDADLVAALAKFGIAAKLVDPGA